MPAGSPRLPRKHRWWMKGAHTKHHKPVAAAGDRDHWLIQICVVKDVAVLLNAFHPFSLSWSFRPHFILFSLDWIAVSAQLFLALPHLLDSARQPYRRISAAAHASAERADPGSDQPCFFFFFNTAGEVTANTAWIAEQAACPQQGGRRRGRCDLFVPFDGAGQVSVTSRKSLIL